MNRRSDRRAESAGRRSTPLRAFTCRCLALVAVAVLLAAAPVAAQTGAVAEGAPAVEGLDYEPAIRTDSPRQTLDSFLRLARRMEAAAAAYTAEPTFAGAARLALLSDEMLSLIDLASVATASRREVGVSTFSYLMDIFGRIGPPDPAAFPDTDGLEGQGDSFRIPGTPLRLVRVAEGEREDEFLFSSSTVQVAPRFFQAVRHLPFENRLGIESFTDFGPQMTGPLVPASVVKAIPPGLKELWLDTPIWKVATVVAVFALAAAAILRLQRLVSARTPSGRLLPLAIRLALPVAMLFAATVLIPFLLHQVNVSGRFAAVSLTIGAILEYAAYAWLLWLGIRMLFEWIIRSPKIPDDSLDANLLRLVSGVIGLLGAAVVLAFGGQAIGLPILSVLAGLGIGGLAVALALRPTVENLVGGVILYIDRPVRVGDFCSFGDLTGTVEGIGIRSTRLRALDRTLISVPNAQFADMQIVNWAECDQMLINETIGVRYETTSDQLRYLLAGLRRMLHAHPRIDSDTVRVRFSGYGDSALKIDIRVYAATREWNDFFAIREDVFLRVNDLVSEAGTGFAFPSRTLYMARDQGLDGERGEEAEAAVGRWRKSGRLPFPRLPRDEIDRLEATLDYPPRGSAESAGEDLDPAVAEPLSTRTDQDAPLPAESEPERRG